MKTLHLVKANRWARVALQAIVRGNTAAGKCDSWTGPDAGVPDIGAAILSPHSALANDANVVLYNQHAGINLEPEFDNHVHVTIGGAFGLTQPSQDAILRLSAGYEFQ